MGKFWQGFFEAAIFQAIILALAFSFFSFAFFNFLEPLAILAIWASSIAMACGIIASAVRFSPRRNWGTRLGTLTPIGLIILSEFYHWVVLVS